MKIYTSITPSRCTKQHIFTKVPVKCLFMVQYSKLKVPQKAGTLLDKSRLESENLCAEISQNRLSRAVTPAVPYTR